MIARLGLEAYHGRKARTLSQGNRQRLGLAMALFHRPESVTIIDYSASNAAVVTGANKGIGLAVTQALARQGVSVVPGPH